MTEVFATSLSLKDASITTITSADPLTDLNEDRTTSRNNGVATGGSRGYGYREHGISFRNGAEPGASKEDSCSMPDGVHFN